VFSISNSLKTLQNKQWIIATILIVFLVLTRFEYLPYLQDATWAVFFVLGFYLRSYFVFVIFILAVFCIDFTQIAARGGHQDFFLAPSYLFIIPAYFCLWFAGRTFAKYYSENLKGLMTFLLTAISGIILCQLISSGGYYWMSLNVIDLSFKDFVYRTFEYLPLALKINLQYLALFAILHLAIKKLHTLSGSESVVFIIIEP